MIRAVFFDAVGTVLHPAPDAVTTYAEIGKKYGSRLEPLEIGQRFRTAFARQEAMDRFTDYRTDERREHDRWRAIVDEVLTDVEDRAGVFEALWEHFSLPNKWRCDPAIAGVLEELRTAGLALGIASNFDRRLRRVVAGHGELRLVQTLCISSEIGWRKPSRLFFEAMSRAAGFISKEILYIGDDLHNDLAGASTAGMPVLLLDPLRRSQVNQDLRLTAIEDLPARLAQLG